MRSMCLHLTVLLLAAARDAHVLGQSTPSADAAAADAALGFLTQPLPPFMPLPPAPPPSQVILDWSAPPQTNWWSLPQQQLCVADSQCGPGFYCHYDLSPLPTSYSTCRPCSLACMVCASATMQVAALDGAACASCACAYTPALPMAPTNPGGGRSGREAERRTSEISMQLMWAPCNTTSQCMDASLTYHVPSAGAYATTPPGTPAPTLPYETFYATRLFCSLSESTQRAAASEQQPSDEGFALSANQGLGFCSSCLSDCSSDADSAEGSCLASCGLPPLATLPSLGLPPALTSTVRGLWPVVALLDAQSLFSSALWASLYSGPPAARVDTAAAAFPTPAEMAAVSADPVLFGGVLSRAGMGVGRSVAAVQSIFTAMDLFPRDGVVTPLEWVYQRG